MLPFGDAERQSHAAGWADVPTPPIHHKSTPFFRCNLHRSQVLRGGAAGMQAMTRDIENKRAGVARVRAMEVRRCCMCA